MNGDEAYPAMLEAIQQARRTVSFVTYIFDRDAVGTAFAHALGEAAHRGVEVRVLIDATGARYSWPAILRKLRSEGVRHALFLPSFALWHLMSMNMRIHRKILVTDGRVGFTGGMNIRDGHCILRRPPHPVRDIHFRVEGPVVSQMQEVFADDWLFTAGESLRGDSWFPGTEGAGKVLARGVTDGPDENFEKLLWTLLGSANWDSRSLRLNFEFNLECYDVELAKRLDQLIETKRNGARPVTMADFSGRPLPARLLDGIARLLTPYL